MAKWSPTYDAYEIAHSRTENWNHEGPTASVTLNIDYDDRILMMYDLLQNRRSWPYPYPEDPSDPPNLLPLPQLRCTSCAIRTDRSRYIGILPDEETMHYENNAYLDLGYTALKGKLYTPLGGGNPGCNDYLYVEEEFEPMVEFLTTDFRDFKWESDKLGVKRGLEQSVIIRSAVLTRTVHGYTVIPPGLLGGLFPDAEWLGKTHCYDYTSDVNGNYYAKDTLVFTNPTITPNFYNLGTDGVNFGYTFSIKSKLLYRPNGWNKWYRPYTTGSADVSGWQSVVFAKNESVEFEPFKSVNMVAFMFNDSAAPTRAQYCASGVLQCGSTYPP